MSEDSKKTTQLMINSLSAKLESLKVSVFNDTYKMRFIQTQIDANMMEIEKNSSTILCLKAMAKELDKKDE